MSGGKRPGLNILIEKPPVDVHHLLGLQRPDETLNLFILALAYDYAESSVIRALRKRGHDTTGVANGRCDDVYRMKVSSAVNEVQAAMQMQAIPLEPAKTGNGKSNHEAYLEPKGKLVLPPESYQEDF